MRLSVLRNSALLSLIGLGRTQSTTSSWGEPFNVDVSTESLLGSSQQPLTNVVGTSTPATTDLAPIAPITDEFSTTIPTEISTVSSGIATTVVTASSGTSTAAVTVPSSESQSAASASSSQSASHSASESRSVASSRTSASGTGVATQSTAAAAPVGIQGQQKMMGVAGALAGAAGVLFV